MRPSRLTSPGLAASERAALELDLVSTIGREMRAFLAAVERDAAAALSGPVVLAAAVPEPFSRGRVASWWARVADRVVKQVVDWTGERIEDPFVASMAQRVHNSPVPGRVYSDVREVLVQATEQRWDVDQTLTRLAEVVEPVSWQPAARRVVRTEATAAYAHVTLRQLAEEGWSKKRWVAHHDDRTRPSHMEADGQTVGLDAEFLVGGYGLMVPADPSAPPAETASCRCVIVGVS